MRKARLKLKSQSCYYHLTSRISGSPGDFPFEDIEKEALGDKALGDRLIIEVNFAIRDLLSRELVV